MPGISKKMSLLLVITLLATMFAGTGSVSAAATYSTNSIACVAPGDGQDLGSIKISVPTGELRDGDWLDLRLPDDFSFGLTVGEQVYWHSTVVDGKYDLNSASKPTFSVPQLKNAFWGGTMTGITVDCLALNEIRINLGNISSLFGPQASNEEECYFYINLKPIHVAPTSPANISVYIAGKFTSPFVDGLVPVATLGAPATVTERPTITTSPIYAGAASVSGTAVEGASVVLSVNEVAQPAVTANGDNWTVSGLTALNVGDTISVTAQRQGEAVSPAATAIVVPQVYWTVTFYGQGGDPTKLEKQVEPAKSVTTPDEPTRSGYDFAGWYLDPEYGGSQFNFDTPIMNNITLYANWTVSGNHGGGESFPIFSATPSFFELFASR
ncbi:MAG TPA: InlB B-repeat-containing protein [Syntrophomonadaceae bacterium]|nr:InlB B-repeat-containing protein [Syntrophomonadaceae bacterium]